MTGRAKRTTLLFLGLVMILIVVIAASLPGLELQPGLPLPRFDDNRVVLPPVEAEPVEVVEVGELAKALFFLILAGTWLYLLYQMFRGTRLRDLWGPLKLILLLSLGLSLLLILMILLLPTAVNRPIYDVPIPTPTPAPTSPLGPVPPLLFWLVGLGLLAASLLIGFWIFAPVSRPPTTLDAVGLEAEKAWQALRTGLDLKAVIISCYRQMSLALEKEQGLERKEFMTTREFETLLEAAGLPGTPIHQLTQLFEAVRYGNWQPNAQDEQKALQCLEAIMTSSQAVKPRTD